MPHRCIAPYILFFRYETTCLFGTKANKCQIMTFVVFSVKMKIVIQK